VGATPLTIAAGAVPFAAGTVRGELHLPEGAGHGGVVLTHGAGGNCRSQLLVAAAEAWAAAGFAVLRCDLPFRQRRPAGPPSPSGAAADRSGLRDATVAMRGLAPGPLILGGQSYGGRQATMLAAEDPAVAEALLLFSYPLHPPGKPERPRTGHFPQLLVPSVFVQGTTDPFGTIAEMRPALAAIPAPVELIPVERAGHDLKGGRFDLAAVIAAVRRLLAAASGRGRSRRSPRPTEPDRL
jgi:predicted alpha/beta-hydrolase family hydrolase